MYEERDGNLFDQTDLDAWGHGVNCRGVMGAGIAVPFSRLDYSMYAAYKELCYNGDLSVGQFFPWKLDDGRYVYNIATQDKPGANATYTGLGIGLARAVQHAEQIGLRSLGIPRIGCGIGGLKWSLVREIIEETAEYEDFRIVVVTPKEK